MNRRKFLALGFQSTAVAALAKSNDRLSSQFYTPRRDLRGKWAFNPDPGLPNVLLLGDSISIGYTLDVRKLLRGTANVYRPMQQNGYPANCGNTRYGLEHLHEWVDGKIWSLIHFNWGLWDLCYRNPQSKLYGHRDKVDGIQDVPIAQYKDNLRKIVKILSRSDATLIWASTTKVPHREAGRFYDNEVIYNEVAQLIMRKHDIETDDLYSITRGLPASNHISPSDVHYTAGEYEVIARHVAIIIELALDHRKSV